MFTLCTLEDNVRIDPQHLGKPTEQAIANVLEKTFIDRVIHDVGLVVTLYDILKIGEGAVYHSDGGVHYKVTFRVVVFKPFPGELLVGVVTQMTKKGLKISLGFFDDVYVPHEMLMQPAGCTETSGRNDDNVEWYWKVEEDGAPPLYYNIGAEIRIKVHSVKFKPIPSLDQQHREREEGKPVEGTAEQPHTPMMVTARADGTGLGMIGWAWGEEG